MNRAEMIDLLEQVRQGRVIGALSVLVYDGKITNNRGKELTFEQLMEYRGTLEMLITVIGENDPQVEEIRKVFEQATLIEVPFAETANLLFEFRYGIKEDCKQQ
ncbi:MAG: hypothetical protein V2B15_04675 [Bacteroidota bacterium]